MRKLTSLTTYGELKDGKLKIPKKGWFFNMLTTFIDTEIQITVERRKHTRTLKQLAYLWGVCYPLISEHTGETPEQLHLIFKAKFLQSNKTWRGGNYIIHRSTSELSSEEMGDFITSVITEASELGVVIPMPDREFAVKRDFGDKISE